MNDGEWARNIERGDEEAIRLFVRTHHPSLCRFLTGLTRSAEDAEDLAQRAFIKACLYAGTFEGRSSLKTWLHRIAYHEYTHWRRADRESVPLPESQSGDDAFASAIDRIVLDDAVAQLPEPQRVAILLYDWAGLPLDEVAETLGVPVGTVKSRIHHARLRLRAVLSAGRESLVMERKATYRSSTPAENRCADAVVQVRQAIGQWRRAVAENRPPDRTTLEGARIAFAGAFGEEPMSADEARTAVELYHYLLDDKAGTVELLDRYLAQPLDPDERLWAEGEKLCAMAGLCEGMGSEATKAFVERHREYCRWVGEHFASSRLLGVFAPPGAAVCWREAGEGEEWFETFNRFYGFASVEAETRWERFVALRTAATAARVLKDQARHELYLHALYALADEDPEWDRNAEIRVGGWTLELLYARDASGDVPTQGVAARAREALVVSPNDGVVDRHRLGIAAGNLAAAFFDVKAYAESIEFGRMAIELAPYYEHQFLRLAAAVWATGGSRSEVLDLLRRGAALRRCGVYDVRRLEEFADVHADAEFLAAQEG